ncbi:MAG TPA: OstA-like protein, partial [Bacteroidales bacterium]|nr:OstA-like protein [Bacteroidales bacterium]
MQQERRIRLLQADELRFDRRIGHDVKRVIGNVIFEHEGTRMYCDSAWHYEATNSIEAFSRVRIVSEDTLFLYGDYMKYDGNTRIAEIHGNVRLIDGETELTTTELFYDRNTGISYYLRGGQIVDGENVLTSQSGHFMSREDRAHFRNNVVLTNPEYTMHSDTLVYDTRTRIAYFFGPTEIRAEDSFIYCENGWYDTQNDVSRFSRGAFVINREHILRGDSLHYDRLNEIGMAWNNVMIDDTVQEITFTGQFAEYFGEEGYTFITGQALAIFAEQGDSLFLHADTLFAFFDNAQEIQTVRGSNNARFFRDDFQGASDSLVYHNADSMIWMYDQPILWTGRNQFTADTIAVRTNGRQVEWMNLAGDAFIVNQDDSVRFNQIKGRIMQGNFVEGRLNNILVTGNSETVYYVREEDGELT